MKFNLSYYEDEVREGYFIPSMIKRSWATQLDILEFIRKVCEKHKIKWFADCGTLIGAIRHGGFIPWDDDLDICMLRDDYERFNDVIGQELPEGYKILNLKNEIEYKDLLTRITGSTAINLNLEYLEQHHGFPYVSGVDIFPLDYIIPDDGIEEIRRSKLERLFQIVSNIDLNPSGIETKNIIQEVEALCDITVNRELPIKAALLRIMESLFKSYDGAEAEFVALMPYWARKKNHKYPISYFEHIIEVPFENTTIQVPAAYGEVLKIEYGTWEIPNRAGGVHEYPFYKSQESILEEHYEGKLPYRYYFNIEDIQEVQNKHTPKQWESSLESFLLMSQANDILWKMVLNKDYGTAIEILQQSQSLAINVGTSVEEIRGEGNITVEYLEYYCELIYQFSQVIVEGDSLMIEESYKELTEQLDKIVDSYHNDRKKTVLFFPFNHSHWKQMEFLYDRYLMDDSIETVVIPIPYYERLVNGTLGKEYYELEKYPSYLNVIDYRTFDYEETRIDEIVIQCPYDEYNSSISVHPFFYVKHLRKYTDKLTYIPYFEVDDIHESDLKSLSLVPYYAVTPGVIHSDEVIVSTENMRQRFLDVLTKLSNEIAPSYWEHKITLKSSDLIKEEASNDLSISQTNRDGVIEKVKKTILFYSGISEFVIYDEDMIKKLEETIGVFKQNNMKVLWVNEYGLSKNLKQIVPSLYEEYQHIVGYFKAEDMGEYYEGSDISDYVNRCDAYYGPGGYVMNLCHRKGVPVMLQRIT